MPLANIFVFAHSVESVLHKSHRGRVLAMVFLWLLGMLLGLGVEMLALTLGKKEGWVTWAPLKHDLPSHCLLFP